MAVISTAHKMAVVVRSDLGMTFGKISSQCIHAALAALRTAPMENVWGWYSNHEPLVVLSADGATKFSNLKKLCLEKGVPLFTWVDSGKTQVPPNTDTIMVVGPAHFRLVNLVCDGLSLYK